MTYLLPNLVQLIYYFNLLNSNIVLHVLNSQQNIVFKMQMPSFKIEIQLINNIVLVSGGQQSINIILNTGLCCMTVCTSPFLVILIYSYQKLSQVRFFILSKGLGKIGQRGRSQARVKFQAEYPREQLSLIPRETLGSELLKRVVLSLLLRWAVMG